MREKENLLRILKETKVAIENQDIAKIKNLSNQTINTASLTQDPDNIAIAVIVYSLSKIFEREDYQKLSGWNSLYKSLLKYIEISIFDVEKDNEIKLRKDLSLIRGTIGKLSGKLKKYIQEVFRKAQINKASRIYEHGISMEKTAKLLGITLWELAEYAGKTGISEVPLNKTYSVKSRIKLAERMFE